MRLVFTDPYSGHEILLINDLGIAPFGVSYDPRSLSPPVPWSSSCPHCVNGRDRELSIHLKREIRILSSVCAIVGKECYMTFVVPTNCEPIRVTVKALGESSQEFVVSGGGSRSATVIVLRSGRTVYEGDPLLVKQARRPQILGRSLRLLSSSRVADDASLVALLRPLACAQGGRRSNQYSQWSPCRKLDWTEVVKSLAKESS
jgi:hypothetical protein